MAVHCMRCPCPDLAAPLGLLCRCIIQLPPNRDPLGLAKLTGHKLQSVALNKRNQNAQALRPEKDFSKTHLTLPRLPATTPLNDSVHTQPSRFYPTKTAGRPPNKPLPLGQTNQCSSGGQETVPSTSHPGWAGKPSSGAPFLLLRRCEVPGNWLKNLPEASLLAS